MLENLLVDEKIKRRAHVALLPFMEEPLVVRVSILQTFLLGELVRVLSEEKVELQTAPFIQLLPSLKDVFTKSSEDGHEEIVVDFSELPDILKGTQYTYEELKALREQKRKEHLLQLSRDGIK